MTDELHNKLILVTGGSGFIGKLLVRALRPLCKDVGIYEGDIRNMADLVRNRYDIVCHLAAINKVRRTNRIVELFDVNVNGTLSVMRYCRKYNSRCVFASSSAVYEPAASNVKLRETADMKPSSLYGVTKMLAEDWCSRYAKDFGIDVVALRIFNIYGESQGEVFLIPYLLRRMLKKEPIMLRTPNAVRDFIYAADVIRAFILSCAYTGNGFRSLNVGTGRGMRIRDVMRKMAMLTGVKPITHEDQTVDGAKDYVVADISKIEKTIHWHPAVKAEDGLSFFIRSEKSRRGYDIRHLAHI